MKLTIIAIIILAVFLVGCSEEPATTEPADTEEITDVAEPVDTEEECDTDCFEAKFKACEVGAVHATKEFGGAIYQHTILGKKDDKCEVRSGYTKNPDPVWEGKEMVCRLDTNLDFRTAIMTFEDCEGELYELLNG